jgi:hypothetical protein
MFLLFGLYNQNSVKSLLNSTAYPSKATLTNQTHSEVEFRGYESVFFGSTRLVGLNQSSQAMFLSISSPLLKPLFKIFSGLLFIFTLIFVFSYILILISYKCAFVLPNFLSFSVISMTAFLFSLTTSGTALEGSLNNLLTSIVRLNYNNLELTNSQLKIQETYFSKYENTYFTDKKCSED